MREREQTGTATRRAATPVPAARSRGSKRGPLTRERILRAAVRVVDAEGLGSLSMRRLGRELGVEAMSLYHHVDGKDDVLAGVFELMVGQLELSDERLHWTEQLRALARSYRRLLRAHPNAIPLLSDPHMISRALLEAGERALAALRGAGLPAAQAVHAANALVGHVTGHVLLEVSGFFAGPEGSVETDLEAVERALATGRYPRLAEMVPELLRCDADEDFEYGLDLIVAGIEAHAEGAS